MNFKVDQQQIRIKFSNRFYCCIIHSPRSLEHRRSLSTSDRCRSFCHRYREQIVISRLSNQPSANKYNKLSAIIFHAALFVWVKRIRLNLHNGETSYKLSRLVSLTNLNLLSSLAKFRYFSSRYCLSTNFLSLEYRFRSLLLFLLQSMNIICYE